MSRLWGALKSTPYQIDRLIDHRAFVDHLASGHIHAVCDIDKTYLETEFDTWTKLAQIAFEGADDKVTVAGAPDFLLAYRWGFHHRARPNYLHFVSSSPGQLRSTLEEKLEMDGLDWTSDTFKNQAYNLRKGRMDQLRQHVAYKSLAILRLVMRAGDDAHFLLIGDSAESDAYIYLGIHFLLAGELDGPSYQEYLEAAGIDRTIASEFSALASDLPRARVADILIRSAPGYRFIGDETFGSRLFVFKDYFQASLRLVMQGFISHKDLWQLMRRFHNSHGMALTAMNRELVKLESATSDHDLIAEIVRLRSRIKDHVEVPENGVPVEENMPFSAEPDPPLTQAHILEMAADWQRKMIEGRS